MRRYVDVDNRILREQGAGGLAAAIAELRVGYRDDNTLDLGFVYAGGVSGAGNIDLGSGVTPDAQLIVKPKVGDQRFDGPVVIKNVVFPKTIIDGLIYYSGSTVIENDQIDELLGLDEPTDVEEVELVGQIRFLINGKRQTTRTFPFIIENTLDRDEAAPAPGGSTRVRAGSIVIPNGQSYVDVAFDSDMPDANWLERSFRVRNTVDVSPRNLVVGLMTAKTASGCRVQLTGDTNSVNYHLDFVCDQS